MQTYPGSSEELIENVILLSVTIEEPRANNMYSESVIVFGQSRCCHLHLFQLLERLHPQIAMLQRFLLLQHLDLLSNIHILLEVLVFQQLRNPDGILSQVLYMSHLPRAQ